MTGSKTCFYLDDEECLCAKYVKMGFSPIWRDEGQSEFKMAFQARTINACGSPHVVLSLCINPKDRSISPNPGKDVSLSFVTDDLPS